MEHIGICMLREIVKDTAAYLGVVLTIRWQLVGPFAVFYDGTPVTTYTTPMRAVVELQQWKVGFIAGRRSISAL